MNMLDEMKLRGGKKGVTSVKRVSEGCSKSCMECLRCCHNKNSQFSLLLATLFNQGKEVRNIKGSDVNGMCDLK